MLLTHEFEPGCRLTPGLGGPPLYFAGGPRAWTQGAGSGSLAGAQGQLFFNWHVS